MAVTSRKGFLDGFSLSKFGIFLRGRPPICVAVRAPEILVQGGEKWGYMDTAAAGHQNTCTNQIRPDFEVSQMRKYYVQGRHGHNQRYHQDYHGHHHHHDDDYDDECCRSKGRSHPDRLQSVGARNPTTSGHSSTSSSSSSSSSSLSLKPDHHIHQ